MIVSNANQRKNCDNADSDASVLPVTAELPVTGELDLQPRRPRLRGRSGGSTLAVLKHGVFAQLLLGNFISSMGVWLHTAAAAWVMLELTSSPLMVGLVTGCTFLPRVILAVPAGAIIDVFDRRRMVIAGNVFQAAVAIPTGLLYAEGLLGPWLLVVMTLLLGTGQALAMPAYHSIIQDVVPRSQVAPAVTLNSGSVNVARAFGPAVGGLLIAAGRTDLAFILNGTSYVAICIAAWRIPSQKKRTKSPESVRGAMRTGVRFMRHSPLLLKVTIVSAMFAFASANLQALLAPAAVSRDLGPQGYGLLFSCFGVGALVGALTTGALSRLVGVNHSALPVSVAIFGAAGFAFAIVPSTWAAALAIAVAGAAWVITFAVLNTIVQLTAPTWVRGRVLSIYMMAFTGAMPIGALLAGGLGQLLGTPPAIAITSLAVIAVAVIAFVMRLPALPSLEAPEEPDDWVGARHAREVTGGPIAVLITWEIEPDQLIPFLAAMKVLRMYRHRTGASRWTLFRDPDRPERMTELFEVTDWAEHLRQSERIDRAAARAITHARSFDVTGTPQVLHLVGMDLTGTTSRDWERVFADEFDEHEHEHEHEPDRTGQSAVN